MSNINKWLCAVIIVLSICLVVSILLIPYFTTVTPDPHTEAVEAAKQYVAMVNVSRSYVVYHLRCMGFGEKESNYAVDHCGADWNQEALDFAINFVRTYSPEKLTEVLEWLDVSGFTQENINYVSHMLTKMEVY